jgi:hypothetical protein
MFIAFIANSYQQANTQLINNINEEEKLNEKHLLVRGHELFKWLYKNFKEKRKQKDLKKDKVSTETALAEEEREKKKVEEELRNKKKSEEESRIKALLLKKDWDKEYSDDDFKTFNENSIPALLSEHQEIVGKRERERKCGRVLWSALAYLGFVTMYIYIVFDQLHISQSFRYNYTSENLLNNLYYQVKPNKKLNGIQSYNEVFDYLLKLG